MIELSKIDEDLSVYKNAEKIILFGAGSAGRRIFGLLNCFGIEVEFFVDNDEKKWNQTIYGKKIISFPQLKKFYDENENCLVQIASVYSGAIMEQLEDAGIFNYVDYYEARARLTYINVTAKSKNIRDVENFLADEYLKTKGEKFKKEYYDNVLSCPAGTICIQCQAMRTGNYTLMRSFERYGVMLARTMHIPEVVKPSLLKNIGYDGVKIITAVREPISQNLSAIFQYISDGELVYQFTAVTRECPNGDVQLAFESLVEASGYFDFKKNKDSAGRRIMSKNSHACLIQDFLKKFNSEIFDLYSVPFDKERGYSIIKTEDMEIFVFQLEKLNEISGELFKWAGHPEIELVKSNVTSEKWTAEVYERAKKEIRFPGEYFEKCFNEPYVRHFYSDEDIEKFKRKWEKNII